MPKRCIAIVDESEDLCDGIIRLCHAFGFRAFACRGGPSAAIRVIAGGAHTVVVGRFVSDPGEEGLRSELRSRDFNGSIVRMSPDLTLGSRKTRGLALPLTARALIAFLLREHAKH